METPTEGYSMPLSSNRLDTLIEFAFVAVCIVGLYFLERLDGRDNWLYFPGVLLPCTIVYLYRFFAQIHFIPQGIAVTLWGRILRKIPASQIRFISAVRYNIKSRSYEKIAVSTYDREELTALYKENTPKLYQNSREIWFGEWAGAELTRQARRTTKGLKMDRRILWLDWDCERLELLLKMYPHAQWLDCTQKKIFDERMNQR